MRINGSQLHAVAFHQLTERHERTESLRAWRGAQRPDFEGRLRPQGRGIDTSAISSGARGAHEASKASGPSKAGDELDGPADPKVRLLVAIIERMTGKKLHLFDPAEVERASVEAQADGEAMQKAAAPAQRAGWGVEYDFHEVYAESETTNFASEGIVHTADGKEIRFKVELRMERQFLEQTNLSLRLGDAQLKDPLILNFDGTAAELSDTTVSFDLDADGQSEAMRFLKHGSAFLFLDLDGNGRATNGAELFGAKTGKGFEELRQHDTDGDGWIDEDDAAFSFMRLWSHDENGNDEVTDLADADVGAISFSATVTPFALKDASNQLQGQIRSTGVYLAESGGAGTVQQLDIAV